MIGSLPVYSRNVHQLQWLKILVFTSNVLVDVVDAVRGYVESVEVHPQIPGDDLQVGDGQ